MWHLNLGEKENGRAFRGKRWARRGIWPHCVHWIDITAVVFTMLPTYIATALRGKSSLNRRRRSLSTARDHLHANIYAPTYVQRPVYSGDSWSTRAHNATSLKRQSIKHAQDAHPTSAGETRWMNDSRAKLDKSVFIENVVRAGSQDRSLDGVH